MYTNIGNVYLDLCEYKKAGEYFQAAIMMDIELYGDVNHHRIPGGYNNIGLVYDSLGEYTSALEYYNKSLEMKIAIYGTQTNHTDIASKEHSLLSNDS